MIFGLNAWPSKWFTATKGFFNDPAIAFPAFNPTVKQTINPGPAVADIPSILSNVVSSQIDEHKEFGGVVPEIAARAHVEKIEFIIKKALKESSLSINNINGISATAGPGLIVCLAVGLNAGKAIAGSLGKPFVAVNHLEGHALSPKISNKIKFPYLLLLISGGHTQFLEVKGVNNYKRFGTTIDDALGEAFDKTAKLLVIEFPGGPKIEEWAKKGD